MATSLWGRLESCYHVILIFLIRILGWTLLFVVNRQGWSNFTPWKVRQISVMNQSCQGYRWVYLKNAWTTFLKHAQLSSRGKVGHKSPWGGCDRCDRCLGNHGRIFILGYFCYVFFGTVSRHTYRTNHTLPTDFYVPLFPYKITVHAWEKLFKRFWDRLIHTFTKFCYFRYYFRNLDAKGRY